VGNGLAFKMLLDSSRARTSPRYSRKCCLSATNREHSSNRPAAIRVEQSRRKREYALHHSWRAVAAPYAPGVDAGLDRVGLFGGSSVKRLRPLQAARRSCIASAHGRPVRLEVKAFTSG